MDPRPPFDPRADLRVELHDRRAMSVYLDGQERIDRGLVIRGNDPLVATHECGSCGLWECNLAEDYAARVRRFGPYVLWITVWSEQHCFALERYREVFGDVSALPGPGRDDCEALDEPARAGAYRCPDGRTLSYDVDRAPDEPLARLSAWRGEPHPGLEAVPPPARAIELPSLVPGAPSLWLDADPRAGGRCAAFLPGVFVLPVWLTSPEVDQVVAAAR